MHVTDIGASESTVAIGLCIIIQDHSWPGHIKANISLVVGQPSNGSPPWERL